MDSPTPPGHRAPPNPWMRPDDDATTVFGLLDTHELSEHERDRPSLLLDVPYVPTDDAVVGAMLELAQVRASDLLYDLGCGDGRIVVTAAVERGARGIGIDLDPARIAEAMELAGLCRVEHLVDFREADLFEVDFSPATVVCLYLLDNVNLALRERLQQQLRPGTRIVSHTFDMDDWKPDAYRRCGTSRLYLWVVPAQVAGAWQWQDEQGRSFHVELEQQHQMLSGAAWIDDTPAELVSALLRGELLELRIRPAGARQPIDVLMRFEDDELVVL